MLIVDQLEELVTLCHDPVERAAFVDAILAHPGGLIVTVRADLYGEFGVFDQLAERLASSQVLLGPLAEQDLRRAVHEPARRCGLHVEDGLAEVIAAELADAPGALPLLGHALREAWLRREGRTITLAGYRGSGGVRSAIAATADAALAALDAEDQEVARRILLRMVELRPDGDDVRRWASRREVTEIDTRRAADVVGTLADARLLVIDRDQITVVHEALLRAWPRLDELDRRGAGRPPRPPRGALGRRALGGGRASDGDLYRGLRLDAASSSPPASPFPGRTPSSSRPDAGCGTGNRPRLDGGPGGFASSPGCPRCSPSFALAVGAIALLQRNEPSGRVAADEAATIADARRAGAEGMEERRMTAPCCSRPRDSTSGTAPESRGNLLNTIERNPQALESSERPAPTGRRGQRPTR